MIKIISLVLVILVLMINPSIANQRCEGSNPPNRGECTGR